MYIFTFNLLWYIILVKVYGENLAFHRLVGKGMSILIVYSNNCGYPFLLFCSFFIDIKLYTLKFTLLKGTIQWFLYICRAVQSLPLSNSRTSSSPQKRKPASIISTIHSSSSSHWRSLIYFLLCLLWAFFMNGVNVILRY